jgi:hypothetical protein
VDSKTSRNDNVRIIIPMIITNDPFFFMNLV